MVGCGGGVSHYSVQGWYDNVKGIFLLVVGCGGDDGGAAGVVVGECGGVGGNMLKVGVGGVEWGAVIVFAVGNSIRFRSCSVVGAVGRKERRVVVTGGVVVVVSFEMFVVGVGMIGRVIIMSAVGRGIRIVSGVRNRSDRGTMSGAEVERGLLNFLRGGDCTPAGAGVPFGISGVR